MNARARSGALRALVVTLSPLLIGSLASALAQPALLSLLPSASARPWLWGALGVYALAFALALGLGFAAQRLPQGKPGRLRWALLGHATAALGLAGVALCGVLLKAAASLPQATPLGLEDALLLFPRSLQVVLAVALVIFLLGALLSLSALVGLWFLVPLKVRRVFFAIFDVALIAVFAWVSLRFDFRPKSARPEDLLGPTARLLASFLLGLRIGARLLPRALDLIESVNFRALVAARHLRAKKSGFLAAISFLSIMAVSVSSCALTTTLSVMGGFRQDLKRKILGNNAHIVIDRAHHRIQDFEPLVEKTRVMPQIRGVAPYVTGEVMISSASNLAGAVLRGIDVAHIGEVSDLPQNMKMGSLEYLAHPDKLSRLPPSQLGLSLGMPKVTRDDREPGLTPPDKASRLSRELKELLEGKTGDADLDPEEQAPSAPEDKASDTQKRTLPGIVVGQELARSLRLYLGDEVNVVTPLGELGPTGPMPKSRPFRVAGIFYSGMYEYDMKFAYVTLESAQRFLGAGDSVSGIEVTVHEPERAQETAVSIARALAQPELRVRAWQELNQNLFGALALEKLAMFIALGIAILVASFCIVGTLTLMVQEKGREVAVLKAMGAGDRSIVAIFVLEGTLIGVFGSLLGLALGYVMCFAMEHFGVRLNPEVYYIDRLPVHTDISEFLAVGISAVIVCLFVTIYPAQLASRLRPVDALRYE